jgi:hypothetical protein
MYDAVQVLKLHRKYGVAFDPKALGFVLTEDRIEAEINRKLFRTEEYIAGLAKKAA